jgi:GntR family transcriptional repressor for pyruvate dehydrogenase complex
MKQEITQIKRVNMTDKVFQQLRDLILRGKWQQGEKIPSENELADGFGVSRVTVRNALQRLNSLGIIETRLGEGSFVKSSGVENVMSEAMLSGYLNKLDINEVLDYRVIIEPVITGLAVTRATDDEIDELKQIFQEMQEAINDIQEFAALDLTFHYKIAEITKNSLVETTFQALKDIMSATMEDTVKKLDTKIGIPYHRGIIAAFEERDAEKASDIMKEHIQATKEAFNH